MMIMHISVISTAAGSKSTKSTFVFQIIMLDAFSVVALLAILRVSAFAYILLSALE